MLTTVKLMTDHDPRSEYLRSAPLLQILPHVFQAHNKVPEDAWEYHTRKALKDAAYKGLDYVPYCSTMPVQPQTDEPKFMWVRRHGYFTALRFVFDVSTTCNALYTHVYTHVYSLQKKK